MGEGQGVLTSGHVRTARPFVQPLLTVVKAPVKARCFPHPEGRAHGRVSRGPSRRTVTGRSMLDFSMSPVRGQSCHAADTNRASTGLSRNKPCLNRASSPSQVPGLFPKERPILCFKRHVSKSAVFMAKNYSSKCMIYLYFDQL